MTGAVFCTGWLIREARSERQEIAMKYAASVEPVEGESAERWAWFNVAQSCRSLGAELLIPIDPVETLVTQEVGSTMSVRDADRIVVCRCTVGAVDATDGLEARCSWQDGANHRC